MSKLWSLANSVPVENFESIEAPPAVRRLFNSPIRGSRTIPLESSRFTNYSCVGCRYQKGVAALRVISKSRLVQFWESPGCGDSEGPLRAWHTHVSSRTVDWNSWADIKADFASASHVGNCVVFNIGGNKVRLIARVLFPSHKVFVLKVMTHTDCDDGNWKEDCGCHDPPPKKKSVVKKMRRKGK